MKLLIIGNSHCNSLKHASDEAFSPINGRVSFISAPGAELKLDITNTHIIPRTSRLYTSFAEGLTGPEFCLGDYDAFAIVGMAMVTHQPLRLLKQGYRLFTHRQAGMNLLSRGAYKAALAGLLGQSVAFEIANQLRSTTDKPIFLVAQPIPVGKIKTFAPQNDQQKEIIERWRPAFDLALAKELDSVFVDTMNDMAMELRVQFLAQPQVTRGDFFTKDEYQLRTLNAFSAVSSQTQEVEDLAHMNTAYGQTVVAQIIAATLLES